MQADEFYAQCPELFEGVDQLAQTSSKAVISIDYDSIKLSLAAMREHLVQLWPAIFRSANTSINVLGADIPSTTLAIGAYLAQLHLRVLAVVRAHSSINCSSHVSLLY